MPRLAKEPELSVLATVDTISIYIHQVDIKIGVIRTLYQ